MKLQDASNIKVGSDDAYEVCIGSTKVWPTVIFSGTLSSSDLTTPTFKLNHDNNQTLPVTVNTTDATFRCISYGSNIVYPVTTVRGFLIGNDNVETLNVSGLDVSGVTDFWAMFYDNTALTDIYFGTEFDTSSATTMQSMFRGCTSLEHIDISIFDTSNVEDFEWMFADCTSLISVDLSMLDMSSMTQINRLFFNCPSLTSFQFPSNLDFTNCTDISYMFEGCTSLESISLTSWRNMSSSTQHVYIFHDCDSLTEVYIDDTTVFDVLTGNGLYADDDYVPAQATIHYNGYSWTYDGTQWTNGVITDWSTEYLTMIPSEAGYLDIYWPGKMTAAVKSISYSINGTAWVDVTKPSSTSGLTHVKPSIAANDRIRIKCTTSSQRRIGASNRPEVYPYDDRYGNEGSVHLGCTVPYTLAGNIMSLLYGDDFVGKTAMGDYAFAAVFAQYWQSSQGQNWCYVVDASNLILPDTTSRYCYADMFNSGAGGHSNLIYGPYLPALRPSSDSYYRMFYGCATLMNLKVAMTSSPSSSTTKDWLYVENHFISTSGTMLVNRDASWASDVVRDPTSESGTSSGVPPTWTYQYYN